MPINQHAMKNQYAIRAYTAVFTITACVSALLLFIIQPMFSKMILPLLGGTPQVWNTAMVFFQTILLAGYGYAHIASKYLSIRMQIGIHAALLLLFSVLLPMVVTADKVPVQGQNPVIWQLFIMLAVVGGPFFILSASAPMLQSWFSKSDHKNAENPYFLYAASNLGSIASLLAYPFVIEPFFDLGQQAMYWQYGYYVLCILICVCALPTWNYKPKATPFTNQSDSDKLSRKTQVTWIFLAFVPASLLLGVTTHITSDIAPVPLLWVIPLALYLITFVIAFAQKSVIDLKDIRDYLGLLVLFWIALAVIYKNVGILFAFLNMLAFFFIALVFHSKLHAQKPKARHLTYFYLCLSLGGVLGGVLNAILAPYVFIIPLEYALVLCVGMSICYGSKKLKKAEYYYYFLGLMGVLAASIPAEVFSQKLEDLFTIVFSSETLRYVLAAICLICLTISLNRRWIFGIAAGLIFLINKPGNFLFYFSNEVLYVGRNFFGNVKILDTDTNHRLFIHGTTTHGLQSKDPKYSKIPMAYYYEESPNGELLKYKDAIQGNQQLAIIGLGVGTMACYQKKGREFDFYEIDPLVIEIAENPKFFTYLSDCGSPYKIISGDARITLAKAKDQSYDFMLIDAYHSDNIPIHLITKEAVGLYLKKLKTDGILGFHISNRYMDLKPILKNLADHYGLVSYFKKTDALCEDNSDFVIYATETVAFVKNSTQKAYLTKNGYTPIKSDTKTRLWTDTYSNILQALDIM